MMGTKIRYELLLFITIIVNIFVMLFVVKMNTNASTDGISSKIELLKRLEGLEKFQHKIGVQESFQFRINDGNSKEEFKEAGEGGEVERKDEEKKTTEFEDPFVKKDNNSDVEALLEYCPEGGEKLEGQKKLNLKHIQDSLHLLDMHSIENGGEVKFGGWWKPKHCKPRANVAVLLPFRKRDTQLQMFLYHMHPLLQRQLIAYRIFVIEQAGSTTWNKGAIYNIGFTKILKIDDFDCFIFHDVDLLLENDKNFYGCNFTPAHLSVAVDKFKYKLPYPSIFGGVQAFSKEDYITINGYSNIYWGWGAEDDDLYTRVEAKGFKLHRPPLEIAKYTMNQLDHFRSDGNSAKNQKMFFDKKARLKLIDRDGLNKVDSLHFDYRVQEEQLFTRILINLKRYKELKV